jgi:hypothetical protein
VTDQVSTTNNLDELGNKLREGLRTPEGRETIKTIVALLYPPGGITTAGAAGQGDDASTAAPPDEPMRAGR